MIYLSFEWHKYAKAWNDLDHNVLGVNAKKLCKALKDALRKIFRQYVIMYGWGLVAYEHKYEQQIC